MEKNTYKLKCEDLFESSLESLKTCEPNSDEWEFMFDILECTRKYRENIQSNEE